MTDKTMNNIKCCLSFIISLWVLVIPPNCTASTTSQSDTYTIPDKYLNFAKELEKSLSHKNTRLLEKSLDIQGRYNEALSEFDAPESFKEGFIQGYTKSFNILTIIRNLVKRCSEYKLIKVYKTAGDFRILFRLNDNGRIIYHIYSVDEKSPNNIYIANVYNSLTGEWLDGERFKSGFANTYKLAYDVENSDSSFITYLVSFSEMLQLINMGDFNSALTVYNMIPKQYQMQQKVQFYHMIIAPTVSVEDDSATINSYVNSTDYDPGTDLYIIDILLAAKKYERAIKTIDNINQFIGGDNYLTNLKEKIILLQNGKHEN